MFGKRRVAFGWVEPAESHWLIRYLEARRRCLVLRHVPINDPHLVALLTTLGAA